MYCCRVLATPARVVLIVGWIGVLAGVGLLAAAATLVGRPTVWTANLLGLVLWLPGVVAVVEASRGDRGALGWSVGGVGVLVVGAVLDRGTRPIASTWEFVLAGSALAVTIAGLVTSGEANSTGKGNVADGRRRSTPRID